MRKSALALALALVLALAIASPAAAAIETHGPASFGARILALVETVAIKITSAFALRPATSPEQPDPPAVDRMAADLEPNGGTLPPPTIDRMAFTPDPSG